MFCSHGSRNLLKFYHFFCFGEILPDQSSIRTANIEVSLAHGCIAYFTPKENIVHNAQKPAIEILAAIVFLIFFDSEVHRLLH